MSAFSITSLDLCRAFLVHETICFNSCISLPSCFGISHPFNSVYCLGAALFLVFAKEDMIATALHHVPFTKLSIKLKDAPPQTWRSICYQSLFRSGFTKWSTFKSTSMLKIWATMGKSHVIPSLGPTGPDLSAARSLMSCPLRNSLRTSIASTGTRRT